MGNFLSTPIRLLSSSTSHEVKVQEEVTMAATLIQQFGRSAASKKILCRNPHGTPSPFPILSTFSWSRRRSLHLSLGRKDKATIVNGMEFDGVVVGGAGAPVAVEQRFRTSDITKLFQAKAHVVGSSQSQPGWKTEQKEEDQQLKSRPDDNNHSQKEEQDSGNGRKRGKRGRRVLYWTPLPLILALFSYAEVKRLKDPNYSLQRWEISCYRLLPWRTLSRTWGWINGLDLPDWARLRLLTWYAAAFDCCLEEAEVEELASYPNLGAFFRRSLKSGARPICPDSSLVSPADGTLLHSGEVLPGGMVEQVKGVSYSLQAFLGPNSWSQNPVTEGGGTPWLVPDADYQASLLSDPKNNALYTAVIYLAPGDYHRFHSPVSWKIVHRRHFPGELLSVNPRVARWISGLFTLNERAVYVGEWEHGFFSMTAVGATNVGSIRVYSDPDLSTNGWVKGGRHSWKDKDFNSVVKLEKGDPLGEFNLGSTIVLLFEAPKPGSTSEEDTRSGTKGYKWVQSMENKVRVGRPIHPGFSF